MADVTTVPARSQPPVAQASALVKKPDRVRLQWPDLCRGIGIILVVFGHSVGGMVTAHTIAPGSLLSDAFYYIYTFHMPLFFFLSGIFIVDRLKSNLDKFLPRSLVSIAYPYFIWSIIQLSIIAMMGSLVNVPTEFGISHVPALLWAPPSQFWFLYALFLLHVVSRFAIPLVGPTGFLIGAIVLRAIPDAIDLSHAVTLPAGLDMTLRFAPFYAVGVAFGPAIVARLRQIDPKAALVTIVISAVAWFALSGASMHFDGNYLSIFAIPAGIAGCAAIVLLAALLEGKPAVDWLVWLGQRSMPIYILHVLFVAGTRIALRRVGVTEPLAVLSIAVPIGIIGPLVGYELAKRLRLHRILGLG